MELMVISIKQASSKHSPILRFTKSHTALLVKLKDADASIQSTTYGILFRKEHGGGDGANHSMTTAPLADPQGLVEPTKEMLYLMFQLSCLSISHLLSSSPVTTQPHSSLKIKMHSISLWN